MVNRFERVIMKGKSSTILFGEIYSRTFLPELFIYDFGWLLNLLFCVFDDIVTKIICVQYLLTYPPIPTPVYPSPRKVCGCYMSIVIINTLFSKSGQILNDSKIQTSRNFPKFPKWKKKSQNLDQYMKRGTWVL